MGQSFNPTLAWAPRARVKCAIQKTALARCQLGRSWHHPSGSPGRWWTIIWGDTQKGSCDFSGEEKKNGRVALQIHFVVCRLIALMAFSLKVLAVKRCFLSLSEFSALIISSSFRKLFIESIALVSLHARQDRRKATYRCTHRADLFNILLKTTRYIYRQGKPRKPPPPPKTIMLF